ncbi:sensor histidine kinase [Micromonospora sp. NBC_01813]|uniref:sensor histidine kinase n=1 Tax=Micromonospora sp. NBC_01813 TaxID=2975988 RepID=UPI002DDC88A7|nr:HAMP domain-containing sensor histidine kinase [Micromonospora sp. NBC_01813]WSA06259.1 HAMP domain-containing histidine kinase [Micromonospora sp. NBC_01813]
MSRSAADRSRRLRWWPTALFTVINMVGPTIFGSLLIDRDAQQRQERMDAELHRVTSSAVRLIQYGQVLDTRFLAQDPINNQCPQFAVLSGESERFSDYFSASPCVEVDPARLTGLVTEGIRRGSLLYTYVRGTGGELLRVGVEPFRNDNGQYIGAIVAVSDATGEQTAHDRLVLLVLGGGVLLVVAGAVVGHLLVGLVTRPVVTALEQQEVLLADTAHDLRTPVAALRALAEAARDNPARRDELMSRAVALAGRMGTIIDDLLARARLAAGVEQLAIEPVWLDQLVTTVVREASVGEARVTVTAAATKVNADPGLVQRAVANLLDNALRHGRRPGAAAIVHVTVAGGRVMVADQGPGIDPSLARENFERFSSNGGSSGLGLSIVRWVAQAHGGTLRVYNAEEGGAIFELVLPAADS